MTFFAHTFCIALMHSLWQTAILVLGYYVFIWVYGKLSPQANRNLLLLTLVMQVLLFGITFVFTYNDIKATGFFLNDITSKLHIPYIASILYQWLFAAYLFIVFFKLIKDIYRWFLFKKQIATEYIKPLIDVRLFTNSTALHLGITRKVQLWYSDNIDSPITYGFLKPIILLPFSLVNNLTLQQTESIILHELAHIKANDYLINWFVIVTEALFFFNPFVLALCKKIRLQRELHCDTVVLQYNYSSILYAEALLSAAKNQQSKFSFSLAAVSSKKQLLKRILYFSSYSSNKKNKNPLALLLLFATSILLFIALATINLSSNRTKLEAKEFLWLPIFGVENELSTNTPIVSNTDKKITFPTATIVVTKASNKKVVAKPLEATSIDYVEEKASSVSNVLPVALNEVMDDSKQIIIEQEQSGNKPTVMMIYKMVNLNGEWILEPQMIITKSVQDSVQQRKDSTLPISDTEQ